MIGHELIDQISRILLDNVSVFKCNNQAFNNTFLYKQIAYEVARKIILSPDLQLALEVFESNIKCPNCDHTADIMEYVWEKKE